MPQLLVKSLTATYKLMYVPKAEATVITLLSRGVNVNECDNDGRTALMCAAAVGNLSVVVRLLSANADLTIRDSKGKTAAEIAKKRYNLSIFKLLTEASAR